MAPKKQQKKALDTPAVSEEDLAQAKSALADQQAKKRANSNMHYWLKNKGQLDQYGKLSAAQKKDFFLHWFAANQTERKMTSAGERAVGIHKQKVANHVWWSKARLIAEYGETKANAKIAANVLETRPDPDTGLSDEWSLEYRVKLDNEKVKDIDHTTNKLKNEGEITDPEQQAAAIEDMDAATGDCTTIVKKEKTESGEERKTEKDKVMEALLKTPRNVLRNCGDNIVNLKAMFTESENNKYTGALHDDVGKLIPKFAAQYKVLEKFCLSTTSEHREAEACAIATKVAREYEKYNELSEFYNKFFGTKGKKAKKKD